MAAFDLKMIFIVLVILLIIVVQTVSKQSYAEHRTPKQLVATMDFENKISLPETEYNSLFDFFQSFGGELDLWNWHPNLEYGQIWDFSVNSDHPDPCYDSWQGVECDCKANDGIYVDPPNEFYAYSDNPYYFNENDTVANTTCHVTKLILYQFNLQGSFPWSFGNLTHLKQVQLGYNSITGTLPDSLCNLHNLERFSLQRNQVSGTLPRDLGLHWSQLKAFNIKDNRMFGSLPNSFLLMNHIQILFIGLNSFTGTIDNLMNMTSAYYLDFPNNDFSGTFPEAIGRLTSLGSIEALENHFVGTLPASIGALTQLSYFSIDHNQLTGSIPPEIFDCESLMWLYLNHNHFTGDNRLEMAFTTYEDQLLEFAISDNRLTGSLPTASFDLVPNLHVLMAGNNLLTGTLPQQIAGLSQLRILDVSHNALVGTIQQNIGDCVSLLWLQLGENMLTGSLPDSVNSLLNLRRLDVGNNHLSGLVEESFSGGPSNINELMLNNNKFTGKIPKIVFNSSFGLQVVLLQNNLFTGQLINSPELAAALDGQSLSLINLDVSGNKLEGTIPSSIFDSSKLLSVAMSSNCMFTPISSNFCNASNLMVLAMDGLNSACSYNSLTPQYIGTIPDCLFAMKNLTTLHLSGNALNGGIPDHAHLSSSLRDLSLSHNELRGRIPKAFQQREWNKLDLSYNKLSDDLDANFTVSSNTEIALIVNRLSGKLPYTFQHADDVNLLQGSLFECDYNGKDLPQSDQDVSNYSCGTNMLNILLYLWIGLFVATNVYIYLRSFFPSDDKPEIRWVLIAELKRILQQITAVSMLVLMPMYIGFAFYHKNYVHSYAWVLSSVYLSGEAATIVLFISWFGLLALLFYHCETKLFAKEFRRHIRDKTRLMNKHLMSYKQVVLIACVVTFNMVFVVGINAVYVYVELTFNNVVNAFAQVLLAIFKLAWNNYLLPKLLKYVLPEPVDDSNRTDRDNLLVKDHIESNRISVETVLNVFNNIVAPCVATMAVNVNCFYNLLVSPPDVVGSYVYTGCVGFLTGKLTCFEYEDTTIKTNYAPSFSYSYQCASTTVTSYTAVFVYMYMMEDFFAPLITRVSLSTYWRVKAYLWNLDINAETMKRKAMFRPLKFVKSRFAISFISNAAVLLTFGVMYPPLALIICHSVCGELDEIHNLLAEFCAQSSYTDGRMNSDRDIEIKVRHVDTKLRKVSHIISHLLWLLFPMCSFYYAFFLFDTLGDSVGWRNTTSVAVVMLALPLLCMLVYEQYRHMVVRREMMGHGRRSLKNIELDDLSDEEAEDEELRRTNSGSKLGKRKSLKKQEVGEMAEDCCQNFLSVWFR